MVANWAENTIAIVLILTLETYAFHSNRN